MNGNWTLLLEDCGLGGADRLNIRSDWSSGPQWWAVPAVGPESFLGELQVMEHARSMRQGAGGGIGGRVGIPHRMGAPGSRLVRHTEL